MKLRYEQLNNHLRQSLAPIYFISGDTSLLVQETREQILEKATQAGFQDRTTLQIDSHFNWNIFFNEVRSLSLFNSKRLLDLRLSTTKLNDAANKILKEYAEKPSADIIVIFSASKLEGATQSTGWFRAIEKNGVVIQLWPLTLQQLPSWINARLQTKNIQVTAAGLQQLVELTEGNLLAAQQAVEKLYLLYDSGSLTDEQVTHAITDNACFDIFNLVDSCLQGNSKRVIRILSSLLKSGAEPILINWAIAREIRVFITLLQGVAKGQMLQELLNIERVMEKRKPLIQQALKRYNLAYLYHLLRRIAYLDSMIKGSIKGNIENELTAVCLLFTDVSLLGKIP